MTPEKKALAAQRTRDANFGNKYACYDIRLNDRAIARDLWARGLNTAEIARVMRLNECDVIERELYRWGSA